MIRPGSLLWWTAWVLAGLTVVPILATFGLLLAALSGDRLEFDQTVDGIAAFYARPFLKD